MQSNEYKSMMTAMQEIQNRTMSEISELKIGSDRDKLTSKQIAKKIKKLGKSSTLAGWDKIFSRFSPKELHSKIDLEGMLPDYIAGRDIEALFAEDVEEEADVSVSNVAQKDFVLGKDSPE